MTFCRPYLKQLNLIRVLVRLKSKLLFIDMNKLLLIKAINIIRQKRIIMIF